MATIKLSKNAAMRAKSFSKEAYESLYSNMKILDGRVNSLFIAVKDPVFKKYLELSNEMQNLLRKISADIEKVSQYCDTIVRWIDTYNQI